MIQIDDKIVSLQVLEKKFCCDLSKCKGICCVEGDAGAPVDEDELLLMEESLPFIQEYLSDTAKLEVEKQGHFVLSPEGEFETPLMNGKECVFTVFENGFSLCAFEKAYRDGKTDFKKPISCHLYPIRISRTKENEILNFSYWNICDDAFKNGKSCGIPVYESVKEGLVRKYGEEFYSTLKEVAIEWDAYKSKAENLYK